MKRRRTLVIGMILGSLMTICVLLLLNTPWHQLAYANAPTGEARSAVAESAAMIKPHKVDGVNYPAGRYPQEIKNGEYPRSYFPGTEKVGKDEMRVTAVGPGMPNQWAFRELSMDIVRSIRSD